MKYKCYKKRIKREKKMFVESVSTGTLMLSKRF